MGILYHFTYESRLVLLSILLFSFFLLNMKSRFLGFVPSYQYT
uniref:Uncharacterized protein n=1 Tax=virus sp. ctBS918 TaxID=2825807 RepID=A0A8S5RND9_9VIRU|nr:MAG TPA: hypothetical protein [virus sp. ctBS918]